MADKKKRPREAEWAAAVENLGQPYRSRQEVADASDVDRLLARIRAQEGMGQGMDPRSLGAPPGGPPPGTMGQGMDPRVIGAPPPPGAMGQGIDPQVLGAPPPPGAMGQAGPPPGMDQGPPPPPQQGWGPAFNPSPPQAGPPPPMDEEMRRRAAMGAMQ